MIELIAQPYPPSDESPEVIKSVSFFIHFDQQSLLIKSVSTNPTPDEGQKVVWIPGDLGLSFMSGDQNILQYAILAIADGTFEVHKKAEVAQIISSRIDVVNFTYEIVPDTRHTDVNFVIVDEDTLDVFYDGSQIQNLSRAAKFYFTRFDDLSYLKSTLSLDVNILNTLAALHESDSWPNPIRLKIKDTSDLSIYGLRGQITASIKDPKWLSTR